MNARRATRRERALVGRTSGVHDTRAGTERADASHPAAPQAARLQHHRSPGGSPRSKSTLRRAMECSGAPVPRQVANRRESSFLRLESRQQFFAADSAAGAGCDVGCELEALIRRQVVELDGVLCFGGIEGSEDRIVLQGRGRLRAHAWTITLSASPVSSRAIPARVMASRGLYEGASFEACRGAQGPRRGLSHRKRRPERVARARRAALAIALPRFVKKEFEGYLDCGPLCWGFARLRCDGCEETRLVAFSCKGRGFCPS